jgi:hypothetical protein
VQSRLFPEEKSGSANHDINARVVLGTPLNAALTLSADSVVFGGGSDYSISGVDHRPSSRGGGGALLSRR